MEKAVNIIDPNDYILSSEVNMPLTLDIQPLTLDIQCEKIVLRHDSVEIDINSHIEEEIKKFKYIIIHGITFERKE